MKNKKKKILIILLILSGILLIMQNLLPVRLNCVDKDGNEIHVRLSKEDGDNVRRIISMREKSTPDTCGYSLDLSFTVGISTCMIASDDCDGIFYHFRYYTLPKEEIKKLRDIVVKYGGYLV